MTAAAVGLALVVPGCSGGGTAPPLQAGSSAPTTAAPTPPPATYPPGGVYPSPTPLPPGTYPAAVLLAAPELLDFRSGGMLVRSGPQLDQVRSTLSSPGLDYCGGRFPSEQSRVSQRLVAADGVLGSQPVVATAKIIQYSSPGAAAQAVTELQAAGTGCDNGLHPTVLGGNRPLQFTFGYAEPIGSAPMPNLAVATKLTDPSSGDTSIINLTVVAYKEYVTIASVRYRMADNRRSASLEGALSVKMLKGLGYRAG